ncbi:MAG: hypothetical protein ABI885_19120 [Gammaproteobacteria bacterium]
MQGPDLTLLQFGPGIEDGRRGAMPLYGEIRRMMAELGADFAQPNSSVYEIGCAAASALPTMHARCAPNIKFVCVDESETLLARRRGQMAALMGQRKIEYVPGNLDEGLALRNASVVLMAWGLGRVRPLNRETLVKNLLHGLNDGGCLLLVEPVLGRSSLLNNLFARHRFDRRSRAAHAPDLPRQRDGGPDIEAVYTLDENRQLLLDAGFRSVEVFFKWYGMCAMTAVK